jgi:pimeloyl-ACP methyl ester carboxylesterase
MTPDRPSDPPLHAGWLREGPFSYTDEGEVGPVLVALHGLPGSARDFRWLAPNLVQHARLIRLEQPGFGGTPARTERSPTLAARARFVTRALDAIGIDRFFVLGHSMGGPLAIAVAASLRERVDGLALLASVGVRPHRMVRKFGRAPDLARMLEAPIVGRALLVPMRTAYKRAGFSASTPDEAIRATQRIFSQSSFPDVMRAVREVRCPSFLAWAEDDSFVESTIGLELGSLLPSGPRIAFPDGGHNVQKSRAIELADAIAKWMARPRSDESAS